MESTSELQSRLSSLSVSSFPGITSKNCENSDQDRLRSTDLSQRPHIPVGTPPSDHRKDAVASPSEHMLETAEGDPEVLHSNGKEQPSGEIQAPMPPLKPPSTWTSPELKELKVKLRQEKDCVVTIYRGDVMTVRVPTVPEGKRICWEFATDGYDIGFGIYFDWMPVTTRNITVQISESSDDEDEEDELEGPVRPGDVEKGSKSAASSTLGEILPVYRQDSHLAVQAGSHEYPGEGTYLLKFDNSYSLWRNKTLYYRVYYSA
ncbi:protein TMED8 [Brienomyrus brachyistius]|uniref:protein TMED8 n=1 Tax=Brienomyrus brachyistius TaxID=42636 RepID=UPI0020B22AE5|nr:protein TMED8 [Brienomyrus brachyistius]XP_048831068.1 protein TMED8 [Brienomyrus brachyistius]